MPFIVELSTATAEFSIEISKSSDAVGAAQFTGSYHGATRSIVRQITSVSDIERSRTLGSGVLTAATEEGLMAQFRTLVEGHGEILD